MKELRHATEDEMVLAFLQADIESRDPVRLKWYAEALVARGADKATLVQRGDVRNTQQNADRRFVLGVRGYGRNVALFKDFPDDTRWQLVKVTSAEIGRFKYANHLANWLRVSGGTRIVADSVKNLDQPQNKDIHGNVTGIAARLHQGERFPALIAVECTQASERVLMEGHHRGTAYALTGLPDEIELFVGTSTHMDRWVFF